MTKMFSDEIDYETLVHDALRDVVKNVLMGTAKNGLVGDHHFYICFATQHPLVELPEHLRKEYPEDMTIVIEHEFWDLSVDGESFGITLCFDEIHERINIPFNSIISFVDPSVKFGLQFNPVFSSEDSTEITETKKIENASKKDTTKNKTDDESNVVSIDFSKQK